MNGIVTIGAFSVALHPLLPWWLLATLGGAYLALILFAFARHARGTLWRVVAGLLITGALLDPSLLEEQRAYQKDVAVVLVDRSPSQNLSNRAQETNAALADVRRQLGLFPDLEVRVIEGGGGAAATAAMLLAALLMATPHAQAQPMSDKDIITATASAHLAYVRTGAPEVDATSKAGLKGLTEVLLQRTSADVGDPVGVDLESDDLIFYPLIYWPVTGAQRQPSEAAIAKLNKYLANGGLIFFDTADQNVAGLSGGAGPGAIRLQELTQGLDVPPLVP
ncbi:MAG: DUF4159 domain-containing protein, partial [Dongia sp.]